MQPPQTTLSGDCTSTGRRPLGHLSHDPGGARASLAGRRDLQTGLFGSPSTVDQAVSDAAVASGSLDNRSDAFDREPAAAECAYKKPKREKARMTRRSEESGFQERGSRLHQNRAEAKAGQRLPARRQLPRGTDG